MKFWKKIHQFRSQLSIKNLNTLKDEGLVVEVNIVNQKARYDIYEHPHIHVVCENCGSVEDMSYDDSELGKYQEALEKKIGNIIAPKYRC